jgi:hypothetical protein
MPINNGYIVLPIMAKIISTPGFFAYCLGLELTLALQMWFGSMQVFDSLLVGTMSVLIIGPSGVLALPLAAGINVVAIVLGIIFLLSSEVLTFPPERGQEVFCNFAWAPK